MTPEPTKPTESRWLLISIIAAIIAILVICYVFGKWLLLLGYLGLVFGFMVAALAAHTTKPTREFLKLAAGVIFLDIILIYYLGILHIGSFLCTCFLYGYIVAGLTIKLYALKKGKAYFVEIFALIDSIADNSETLQSLIDRMQPGINAFLDNKAELESRLSENEESWNVLREHLLSWGQIHDMPAAMPDILTILGESPADFNARPLAERLAVGMIRQKAVIEKTKGGEWHKP